MSDRTEPVYFKVPSALKQDLDTLCAANGYTKTIFLTNYIHEKVEELRKTDPKLFKSSSKKRRHTDDRGLQKWLIELTQEERRNAF